MPRTTEQVAADDALTASIEAGIAAYYGVEQPFILSEYIVVLCQQTFDDEGDGLTAIGTLYRDGDVPPHRALGLLDYASTRLKRAICDDDEDV